MDVNFKTAELGHSFGYRVLRNQVKAIWGGVSWPGKRPGKRPGFAVVVGMDPKPHLDSNDYDVYLLDEYESSDTLKLVRQCRALDVKYCISLYRPHSHDVAEKWVGDYKNDVASRFIQELNAEQERAHQRDFTIPSQRFSLSPPSMLEMENLYSFILPQIKALLSSGQLFLKDGMIKNYLSEIEEDDLAELELGAYPAIEALAFAVIEMRSCIAEKERTANIPESDPWDTGRNLLDFGQDRNPIWT